MGRAIVLISLLAIAALLFVFGFVALDVATRKPSGFDHCVILALRRSAKEPVPIGPPWLQEAARDVTSLGSIIVLLIITFAVAGYLFLARKPGVAWLMLIAVFGGLALNNFLKAVFARLNPELPACSQGGPVAFGLPRHCRCENCHKFHLRSDFTLAPSTRFPGLLLTAP